MYRRLALLNSTAQLLPNGATIELLTDGVALLNWMATTDLITGSELAEIRSLFSTTALDRLASDANDLREWFRMVLPRVLEDQADLNSVTDHLNDLLAKANIYHQLRAVPGGVAVAAIRRWTTAASVLALIAEQIADLIVDDGHSLIRNCENSTCTLWFYDRTKAHRRRWCSMAVCGNRAKAQAHRDRQRSQTAPSE